MATRVTDRNNTDRLLRTLRQIQSKRIEVGIFSSSDGDILIIANVHEFGSNANNIPERSFLRAGFDKYHSDIADMCERMIVRAIEGNIPVDSALNAIGTFAVSKIQQFLTEMDEPKLKQATIDAKGSSKLLIDTGRLRSSISYRIR